MRAIPDSHPEPVKGAIRMNAGGTWPTGQRTRMPWSTCRGPWCERIAVRPFDGAQGSGQTEAGKRLYCFWSDPDLRRMSAKNDKILIEGDLVRKTLQSVAFVAFDLDLVLASPLPSGAGRAKRRCMSDKATGDITPAVSSPCRSQTRQRGGRCLQRRRGRSR